MVEVCRYDGYRGGSTGTEDSVELKYNEYRVPVLPPLYPSYLQNFYHYLLPDSSNIYYTVQGSNMTDRKSYGSDGENDDILTTLIVHHC